MPNLSTPLIRVRAGVPSRSRGPGAPELCFAPGRQIIASPGALEAFFAPGRRRRRGIPGQAQNDYEMPDQVGHDEKIGARAERKGLPVEEGC